MESINSMGKKTHIEFLRIIAAFLVIVNHTIGGLFLGKPVSVQWVTSLTVFFASKVAVPLFLFIMGAVLLGRQDTPRRSLSRILRITGVIVLFSLVYYLRWNYQNPASLNPVRFFIRIFSEHIISLYWYLYVYLGLLFMLPLMQKMSLMFSKKELRLLILLSVVVMGVFPLITLATGYGEMNRIKSALINPYIGMVFAGYYMEKHAVISRRHVLPTVMIFAASIAVQVFWTWKLYGLYPTDYLQLDDRTYLTITSCAACVYLTARYFFSTVRISDRACGVIRRLGSLTFGIYLVSDLVMKLTAPAYDAMAGHIPGLPAVMLWSLLIFCLGALITMVMKKLPVLKKLL